MLFSLDKQQFYYKQAHEIIANATDYITQATKESVDELSDLLRFAEWKYYVLNDPLLADQEYDQLFKILQKIERNHPEWKHEASPTQRIFQGLNTKLEAAQHLVPMLSLENSYNAADLNDWDQKNKSIINENIVYTVEPKYDGASISLFYENDILVRATTRGNGVVGEDVTTNIKQIKSIPLQIALSKFGIHSLEIRGEVIIPKDKFAQYNEIRAQEGLALLANPRNAASGTLRMLDPEQISKRGLHAVLYHISYYTLLNGAILPEFLNSHYQNIQWLHQLGFYTPINLMKKYDTIDGVIDRCLEFETQRDELNFEIDGMVIKVDALKQQEELGMTTHHPRWAMAFKFKARQATSILRSIQYQVGRTGNIAPVAKIDPVFIGGVTVSSVSLFNEDVIKEKDLMIGDTILVERAGDVIPYIVKSLSELRTGNELPIVFPTNCPVCEEAIVKPTGEAAWRCVNINCAAQVVERIIHFASKDAMDIRNLGDANIRRFFELGYLNHIEDIYHLPFDKLVGLEKLGAKSIENLKFSIEQSKAQPTNRLLYGLGIRFVGETTAKTIVRAIPNLKSIKDWSIEQLQTLEDVGPKVAASIYEFFSNIENQLLLDRLAELGLNIENKPETSSASSVLEGKTFLFTGTLSMMKRSEAEAQVEQLGGKLLSGVSAKLNYLVVGTDAGSKLEKAKKLGNIAILSEVEFLELIKEASYKE